MGKVVKKIGKAVKKAVKQVTKPIEKLGQGVRDTVVPTPDVPDMPEMTPAAPAAALVEVPADQKGVNEDEAQTEAGRKKAARGGKKSLSVARSSGGGLNI